MTQSARLSALAMLAAVLLCVPMRIAAAFKPDALIARLISVIFESVFARPGVGRLLVEAIGNRDYPLVQAAILVITSAFVVITLLVDLSYGYLDPRIRLG